MSRLWSRVGIGLWLLWHAVSAAAANPSKKTILGLGLPVVFIETVDGVIPSSESVYDKNGEWMGVVPLEKVPGRIYIQVGDSVVYDSGEYLDGSSGMTIRVRGNSTALRDKKPYKVKLQQKADLLRRGDKRYNSKDWVLLKRGYSVDDLIGFEVNRLMGMPYQPAYEYVNLFMNGNYRGLYIIAENVKRDNDCRINVDKQTGFIVELDPFYYHEDLFFITANSKFGFTYKYPDSDDVDEDTNRRVMISIKAMEDAVGSGDYSSIIDIDSWARFVLAHDILATWDTYGSNMFYAKYDNSRSSRIFIPCLWDFDSVMKNSGLWGCKHEAYLFTQLFESDNPDFCNAYHQLWDELHETVFEQLDSLLSHWMDSNLCKAINFSMRYDPEWYSSRGTFTKQLSNTSAWFQERHQWLMEHINDIPQFMIEKPKYAHDLNGRRIYLNGWITKGIYIVDGKKYYVK